MVKEISFHCCFFFSFVGDFWCRLVCLLRVLSGCEGTEFLITYETYLSKCHLDASLLERLEDQPQWLAAVDVASVHYSSW